MGNAFLDLIKVNEEINYTAIISIVVGYLAIIWFVVCIWVYYDANKRFRNFITPWLFLVFVLVFGPPALIFYIMIRPEHTLEEEYLMDLAMSGEKELQPIRFDGNKGFNISLNISVEPKKGTDKKNEMNMNVEWLPQERAEVMSGKKGSKGSKFSFLNFKLFLVKTKSSLSTLVNRSKRKFKSMRQKSKVKKGVKKKKEDKKKKKSSTNSKRSKKKNKSKKNDSKLDI